VPQSRPKKVWRAEYYRWLLRLGVGDRMIRYGCDQYFNALKKQPRRIKHKPRKKRPYPGWLKPYMFGGGKLEEDHHFELENRRNSNESTPVKARPDYWKLKR